MDSENRDPKMDSLLQDWAQDRVAEPVGTQEAVQLQRVVQARLIERRRARVRQGLLLAAATVLAFLVLDGPHSSESHSPSDSKISPIAHSLPSTDEESRVQSEPSGNAMEGVTAAPEPQLALTVLHTEGETLQESSMASAELGGRLVLGLGEDVLALGEQSQIHVESSTQAATIVHLKQGTVAAEVASRGADGSFQIQSGEVSVRVIGTRFGVERGEALARLRVWVAEGIVEVQSQNRTWKLGAGQELRLGETEDPSPTNIEHAEESLAALLSLQDSEASVPAILPPQLESSRIPAVPTLQPSSPPESKLPSLNSLRQSLSSGDTRAVIEALQSRLSQDPEDPEAWDLLARAAARSGDGELRLQALKRVIELAKGPLAQNARYNVALLLTQEPHTAVAARAAWQDFLQADEGPGPLENEALLALARLEIEDGNPAIAREYLLRVTTKAVGTVAADEAARLLAEIREE